MEHNVGEQGIEKLKQLTQEIKNLDQVMQMQGGLTGKNWMAAASTWNYDHYRDRAFHKVQIK